MSQLSYNRLQVKAIPGMKADIGPDKVISLNAEADLDIGIGLVQGTTADDVITPADTGGQVFRGFSAQSHDRENLVIGTNNAIYQENAPVNVFTFGSIWVFYTGTPARGSGVILSVTAAMEGWATDTGGGNTVAATGWKIVQLDSVTGLAEITNVGA